jgi:hypothetical protein
MMKGGKQRFSGPNDGDTRNKWGFRQREERFFLAAD